MNINKLICTGRLTKDPELRAISEDMNVCQLRLAVDGMGRGREVGYIKVSVFGKADADAVRDLGDEHPHLSVRRKLAVDACLPLVIVAPAVGGPIERPTSHV